MNPYRAVCNAQAMKAIDKHTDFPDIRLGVGSAETLESLALKVQYRQQKRPVVMPALHETSHELATTTTQDKLKPEDFPTTSFYIGESLGGY